MKQLAFYFDSDSCSGCKTCQIACKDKNNLQLGIRWRRVYEVSGGKWQQQGAAWLHKVSAYNISMSCNHCAKPVCMTSCPTQAISKRSDGIVEINPDVCVGCKYCEWVCPYGAPQFDENNGVMTKCNLCADYVDEGKNPSCVDACPMRVLDMGEYTALIEKYGNSNDIFPLPSSTITEPSVVFHAHKEAEYVREIKFEVANWEEVRNEK